MAYGSKNPKFSTEILTDQAANSVSNAPSGSHRLVNRNGKLYVKDSSGTEVQVGTASSIGKNYIANPSAAADTTGATASGAGITVARTTTAADLPRDITTATGFKITPVSGTDYVRWRWTADRNDYTRKVGVGFALNPLSGYAAGDLKLDVYATTDSSYATGLTRVSLFTDASAVTSLPNVSAPFQTSFDGVSATTIYYELRITRVSGTTAIVISDLIVGPGVVVQGSNPGPWVAFTPTFNVALGTCTNVACRYRVNGENLDLEYGLTTGTPDNTTVVKFPLPSGYTAAGSTHQVLTGFLGTEYTGSSVGQYFPMMLSSDTSNIQFSTNLSRSSYNPITSGGFTAGELVTLRCSVRVNELIGRTAINVAQNDVEYASVGGTWDADSSTTVYGPGGSLMGGALTSSRVKTLTWATPVGPTDRIQVWGSTDQVNWFPLNDTGLGSSLDPVVKSVDSAGNVRGGATIRKGSTAYETIVVFARYLNQANDDAPTVDWPSSAAYWVCTKAKSGQAIGFDEVKPGTSAGLVSANGLKGSTTGTVLGAGYVGEVVATAIASSITTAAADTYVDGQTVTLQPGVWRLELLAAVELSWVSGTPTPVAVAAIKTGSTIIARNVIKAGQLTSTTDTTIVAPITVVGFVAISAATTYKVSLVCSVANTAATARIYADATNFSGSNVTNDAKLIAVRIA